MIDIDHDHAGVGGVGEVDVFRQMHAFSGPDQRGAVAVFIFGLGPGFGDSCAVFRAVQTIPSKVVEQDLGIMVAPPGINQFAALVGDNMGIKPTITVALVDILVGVALGV